MNIHEKIKDLKDNSKINDKEELQLEILNSILVALQRLQR